jgi:translation initiation factor 2 subunit 1
MKKQGFTMQENLPEINEVVVCRITRILDYGVFAELLEYDNVQGFVHISQVSSSWIKNIRNFVKENQIRAGQVINIDTSKNQIDLSFNKVSAGMQRERIEEWKQSKRSQKLIELIATQNKVAFDVAWKEIAEPLLQEYESLYDAFQGILLKDPAALKHIDKKWHKTLTETVGKNIDIPTKTVKGVLSLTSNAPDGVEVVKSALAQGEKYSSHDAEIDLSYVGSGKYMLKVTSFDYKIAEKVLKEVSENTMESMKAAKGKASFEKIN